MVEPKITLHFLPEQLLLSVGKILFWKLQLLPIP